MKGKFILITIKVDIILLHGRLYIVSKVLSDTHLYKTLFIKIEFFIEGGGTQEVDP